MEKLYAIVTGASSGIGRAIAIELAAKKINLILVALPNTGLEETARQIHKDFCIEVKFLEMDLTTEGAVDHFHKWCNRQPIKINILVNNAGLGTQGPFANTTISELETMLKLNNQVLVMMSHYFLPELKLNRPANILNVGSLASFMTIPGKAVYAASKSFIYSFSMSLRMELKPYKINVSCLCPGGTLTSSRVMENIDKVRFAGKRMLQSPEAVAGEAVKQMFYGKKIIIPGWHNKFLYKLWALLPQRIVDLILMALFFKKDVTEKIKIRATAVVLRSFATG